MAAARLITAAGRGLPRPGRLCVEPGVRAGDRRQHTVAEIAEAVGVHRTTVCDYLNKK